MKCIRRFPGLDEGRGVDSACGRFGANNAHVLAARPTTTIKPAAYGEKSVGLGHEPDAVGLYTRFHLNRYRRWRMRGSRLAPRTVQRVG